MAKSLFEHLPSVQELLESPALRSVVDRVNHHAVVTEVRSFLDNLRSEIQSRAGDLPIPTPSELADRIADWIKAKEQPHLRPVINATGELLNSAYGRAPLATCAIEAMAATASDYCNLELNLESGERYDRLAAVQRTLCELTGAERALVVNNGTAAMVLVLAAFASGRQVLLSRGELIETGETDRLPDAVAASGAVLRDVGTTNCTRLEDYRLACGPDTGAILKAHTTDFHIVGHHEAVDVRQLVSLGQSKRIPVIYDLGAGTLVELQPFGILDQPTAREAVSTGADVVVFSGDKWLGAAQCGIILCRRERYAALIDHPLGRALRIDKLTLSALLATLGLYRTPTTAEAEVPVLSLLSTSCDNLKNRAERLAPQIAASSAVQSAEAIAVDVPGDGDPSAHRVLPTWRIAVTPQGRTADQLAQQLRMGVPTVVARVDQDRLWLDLRTVFPRQDQLLVDAFGQIGKDFES